MKAEKECRARWNPTSKAETNRKVLKDNRKAEAVVTLNVRPYVMRPTAERLQMAVAVSARASPVRAAASGRTRGMGREPSQNCRMSGDMWAGDVAPTRGGRRNHEDVAD